MDFHRSAGRRFICRAFIFGVGTSAPRRNFWPRSDGTRWMERAPVSDRASLFIRRRRASHHRYVLDICERPGPVPFEEFSKRAKPC